MKNEKIEQKCLTSVVVKITLQDIDKASYSVHTHLVVYGISILFPVLGLVELGHLLQ